MSSADIVNRLAGSTPGQRICSLVAIGGALFPFWMAVGEYHYARAVGEIWQQAILVHEYVSRDQRTAVYLLRIAIVAAALRVFGAKLLRWIKEGHVSTPASALHFKDADAALDYAKQFLRGHLRTNAMLPCVVDSLAPSPTGTTASVRIAASGRTIVMLAQLPGGADQTLVGKLCAVLLGEPLPKSDSLFHAYLVAELEPTWESGAWKVRRRLP